MKEISIQDLIPMLKRGFVAYDKRLGWGFFDQEPYQSSNDFDCWVVSGGDWENLSFCFNIKPFDGDWKDSLMEVKNDL